MPSYAYFKNEIIPLADAKISVMTSALHYGTAVFEGIRGNWNAEHKQIYLFRLKEHYQRLLNGCKVLKIKLPYTVDDLCRMTVELARKCAFEKDIYVRPLAYKSSEALGVRVHDVSDDYVVFIIPWGRYLDVEKARCTVSSWQCPTDNSIPPQVKIMGHYAGNALAKSDAVENGFDEAIMLSADGYVAQGSGENIFLVRDGKLVTPATYNHILPGITRDCTIRLAKNELGIETVERPVNRAELFFADECFMTGTAAHITPVSEIDHRLVGDGEVGEITRKLQELYFAVIKGDNPKYLDWCTPVYPK
ncbi:MAG: branched-chain amino acid transaminase [Chloroflexi bacterium]|nr:branched-chain amino acid transaminase [Chloroflexota bacterium]